MGFSSVNGVDFTLPAGPPLVDPPLSLLGLSSTLIDSEGLVADAEETAEKAASAQAAASDAAARFQAMAADQQSDRAALYQAERTAEERQDLATQAAQWANDARKRLAELQRWEHGFQYLPELGVGDLEVWAPDGTASKATGDNTPGFAWYDPFTVVARDDRSLFGLRSFEDRAQRAVRGLRAHEAWECEHEFWTGEKVPTNWHLAASASSPTSSPHRTIDAWTAPSAPAGTTLGTAVPLATSLAVLDQSIADADAGVGMIHATPYLVQLWSKLFPFLRSQDGRILTVNFNVIVPGYGYPGSGPDNGRTVTDGATNSNTTVTSATAAFTSLDVGSGISGAGIPAGATIVSVTNGTTVVISAAATATATGVTITVSRARIAEASKQWAYATDMVYKLRGDVNTYPWDWRQAAPLANTSNAAEIRAERQWAMITSRQLRAAVYVDTTA